MEKKYDKIRTEYRLKPFGKNDGFIFYTNYDSKKGRQISENHYGSLLFYWSELEKQIRIEGRIEYYLDDNEWKLRRLAP